MNVRRWVTSAGISIVISYAAIRGLQEFAMDHNEIMAEMINRYVKSAGWDEQPQIFTSSEFHGYITSPLPLSRGCSVKLVFYPNGQWQVGYIQLADEGGYLLQATGKDGKDYPAAAMGLASPTRKQLDQLLSEAGIDCTW